MIATDEVEISRYFIGDWLLSRRVVDRRAGLIGRLFGRATFRLDQDINDGTLIYEESGVMSYGDHEGQASQSHRWRIVDRQRAEIYFSDGRFFHSLDLTTSKSPTRHSCAPDDYCGRFHLLNEKSWRSTWKVSGPRKDLIIASLFRRIEQPAFIS